MKLLSIIIPVYNEEIYVHALLQKVADVDFLPLWYEKEIIIINDGSKDASEISIKKFLETYTWKVTYTYQKNLWKWGAIKHWISLSKWDVYVVQDSDLEYDPLDLVMLLSHLEKDHISVCYGSRIRWFAQYGFQYSTIGFLFGWLFVSFLTTILSWKLVTDEPTCYKMYTKACRSLLLQPTENDFAWEPAVTMLLLKNSYKYSEKPIHYYPRKQQQWKKIKLIDGRKAIKTLFIYRFKH